MPADPIAPQVKAKVKSLEKSIAAAKKKAAATHDHDDRRPRPVVTLTRLASASEGALVVVDGALDYHATEELGDLLAELSESGASRIAIDLERASPVDDADDRGALPGAQGRTRRRRCARRRRPGAAPS